MNIKSTILGLMLATSMTVAAQVSPIVSDIARYVYPNNYPAMPASFTYAADGNGYLTLSANRDKVERYDVATGNLIETVFDVATARETTIYGIEGFEMSPDGRYLLVYNESERVYRRSFKAAYYVYELRSRLLKPLSTTFKKQQAPLFSPDGRMVAFVAENNVYVRKNDYGSEVQVTKDGEYGKMIYGIPDWVYEEEFTTSQSMTWAPDNSTLCYLGYDEAGVPLYTLPQYEGTCNPMSQYALYPGTFTYKYPVAGQKNSKVSVYAYDVNNRKVQELALPDAKIEYVPRIAYAFAPDRLMISTLNRDQNHFEIYCCNPKTTIMKSVYVEDTKAWVAPEAYEGLKYYAEGFVVQSTRSGYNHAYLYSYAGSQLRALTSGEYDVTEFYGFDAKGNYYYQAASPTPLDRTVTKVDAKGKAVVISKDNGTTDAEFTPAFDYAMMRYSDAVTPPIYSICQPSGKEVRMVEDNSAYAARFAHCPKKEFFTMTSDGYTLNGYVLRSESATGKCPVVMYQYSGPGSQSVLNNWSMDWENYFAMQGYAVVCVDGRGTGGRGREFQDVVYRNLGHYETIDQINAARWAAQQPWADASKIGIYGWSYGGYEALMAATEANCPYAAAVAVAPVTSWKYYDTVYAERYMLTPQQNPDGYASSAPLRRAGSLACPLLVMWGTADDNVHPVNSLMFISTLQNKGGFCDAFPFVNMNHSIYGCNARAVVYGRMLQFFDEKLK